MSLRKQGFVLAACLTVCAMALTAAEEKLTPEDRIRLTRELTAEFATAKVVIPRSKDALGVQTDGNTDEEKWMDAQDKWGAAAQVGDLVQITKIEFEKKRIVFQINGGFSGGKKWWQRIQVTGNATATVRSDQQTASPHGTKMCLLFPDGVPRLESADIKKYLGPVMDFEQRSAAEQYVETLPEPVQAAIAEKRATEGMDRDMVLLAMGRPDRKVRETKEDGIEYEDWIYGEFPGKVTFITFKGSKVVEIRERYAGVGSTQAPRLEPTR